MAQAYDRKFLKKLAQKVLAGKASEAEEQFLESYYQSFEKLPEHSAGLSADERTVLKAEMKDRLMAHLATPEAIVIPIYRRSSFKIAAACLLFTLGVSGYLLLHRPAAQQLAQNQLPDIKPGSKKAVLILANGKQISLTDAHSGALAQQGKVNITKTADGEVVYQGSDDDKITYNTIKTPRGGFYPLQMADGSIAILDAGSSIKYPVNFKDGQDRLVEITGQVYFEVKHNASQPFKIKAKGQTIEDIGTKFNINAYDDEPAIRTTLVEGIVKVQQIILKPGEQSDGTAKRKVNIDDVIAWKNGQTSFEGETVQEIMRQVSRWYDVDVVYEGTIAQREFTGGIPRNAKFSDLVKALEFENIHVTLEGKKLIVKP